MLGETTLWYKPGQKIPAPSQALVLDLLKRQYKEIQISGAEFILNFIPFGLVARYTEEASMSSFYQL